MLMQKENTILFREMFNFLISYRKLKSSPCKRVVQYLTKSCRTKEYNSVPLHCRIISSHYAMEEFRNIINFIVMWIQKSKLPRNLKKYHHRIYKCTIFINLPKGWIPPVYPTLKSEIRVKLKVISTQI